MKILFMSIFHTKSHHNFIKLPEMNVYHIYFQTIETKIGVTGVLFEINTHECELHGTFIVV